MKTCIVCGDKAKSKGLCNKHYRRALKGKDPWSKSQKEMTEEERFFDKVEKHDCWTWTGSRNSDGYGNFFYDNASGKAHRWSYEYHHGPIEDGLSVCHSCDHPYCVNPDHLFLGTQQDNIADMVSKERQRGAPGVSNANAVLTETQVNAIRKIYESGGVTQKELARLFDVSLITVSRVLRNRSYVM